jgi:spore maturation protein CgeB
MALAPLTQQLLEGLRSRGIVTASWFVEDCRRFSMWQWQASWFDHFFVIQDEPNIGEVEQAGGREVRYLPCAWEASLAAQAPLSAEDQQHYGTDICFMGSPYPNRVKFFSTLKGFSVGLWGKGWSKHEHQLPGMVREGERLVSPAEEHKIYSASKVLINLRSTSKKDSDASKQFLNPRTFTAAMCGVFQFIDERSLLSRAFEPGKEIATFSGPKELQEKLHYFLSHPDERAAYVYAARDRALREHTYEVRLEQALAMMGLDERLATLRAPRATGTRQLEEFTA